MEDIFFDYFKKVEVDFKDHFEKIKTTLENNQSTKYDFSILNINPALKKLDKYLEDENYIEKYSLQIGDTPFSVAEEIYNDSSLWWLILYINKFTGFDFVMDNNEISKLANILFQKEQKYSNVKTYFDLIFEYNEKRKSILIIKPIELSTVFEKIVKELE